MPELPLRTGAANNISADVLRFRHQSNFVRLPVTTVPGSHPGHVQLQEKQGNGEKGFLILIYFQLFSAKRTDAVASTQPSVSETHRISGKIPSIPASPSKWSVMHSAPQLRVPRVAMGPPWPTRMGRHRIGTSGREANGRAKNPSWRPCWTNPKRVRPTRGKGVALFEQWKQSC